MENRSQQLVCALALTLGVGVAHASPPPEEPENPGDWWVTPLRRAMLRIAAIHDAERPFSTPLRLRDIGGDISAFCERDRGRPCGDGEGGFAEIETGAGYGSWLSTTLELRITAGRENYAPAATLSRALLASNLGPISIVAGRDAFAIGPGTRTQLTWSDHAAPLDHVRVATSSPWALTSSLELSAFYALGRARAPQTYDGNLVSIARVQLDVANTVDIGATQLLQLGGEGAPALSVVDVLLEHVRRGDSSASSADSSNRRFGADVSLRIDALGNGRLYYAVMFEDIRRARLVDAVRYDADHLFGLEFADLGPSQQYGLTLELHRTGVRSQEHTPRTTGFTNAGFVVGAPLGPDATSFYAGVRLDVGAVTLQPWLELARLSSDTYQFIVDGPIDRISIGEDEGRYRFGTRARVYLRDNVWLEGQALIEHVDDFAFESGQSRNNLGITTSIIWYPGGPLGRLSVE